MTWKKGSRYQHGTATHSGTSSSHFPRDKYVVPGVATVVVVVGVVVVVVAGVVVVAALVVVLAAVGGGGLACLGQFSFQQSE